MLTSTHEALYEFRSRLDMSQEEVAEKIGVSRVTYTRYENGSSEPTARNAVRLAHLFGVPVEYLLCMDDLPQYEDALIDFQIDIRYLNDKGRDELRKYINYLLSRPEYKKIVQDTAI